MHEMSGVHRGLLPRNVKCALEQLSIRSAKVQIKSFVNRQVRSNIGKLVRSPPKVTRNGR